MEVSKIAEQFILICRENLHNGLRLVGVCNKDLRNKDCIASQVQWHWMYRDVGQSFADPVIMICLAQEPTLKTWKASNWMDLELSFSRVIMSFRLETPLAYFIMTFTFARSSKSSPSSCSQSAHDVTDLHVRCANEHWTIQTTRPLLSPYLPGQHSGVAPSGTADE